MADTIHCIRKTLRLMPKEAKVLDEKSKEAGLCEAEYLRLLIINKPCNYPEIRILLKEFINEVNAVGNNINQIVKNYNSHFYTVEDRELLKALMKKLNRGVQEVIKKIGNQ